MNLSGKRITQLLGLVTLLFLSLRYVMPAKHQTVTTAEKNSFVCTPCGLDCDNKLYSSSGKCDDCNMQLVNKNTISTRNIASATICSYIQSHPETILLDVRTKDEFEGKADPDYGTLKNAINISVDELQQKLPELQKYKQREILVYCSHSHRSPRAAYLLTQNGFSHVVNMLGGMSTVTDVSCKK